MIAYASRTGTKRNLEAMRNADWRLIVSARGALRSEGLPYALDNGAWTSFQRGEKFDEDSFNRALEKMGEGADWIVVPDIVAGGLESLEFSMKWIEKMRGYQGKMLLAVQDGMQPEDVRPLLSSKLGLFVGGTTEWKLRTMLMWGELSTEVGCYMHVGRVNSAKRINACLSAGAHSFDGTSVTRYAKTLPMLDAARRQRTLIHTM